MPMNNLLECNKSYRKTIGSLRNYFRDEANGFPADNYNSKPITYSESFKYKSTINRKTSTANQKKR